MVDRKIAMFGTKEDVRSGKFGILYGALINSRDGNYTMSGLVEIFQYDNILTVFYKSKRVMLVTPSERTPLAIYNRIYNSLDVSDELVTLKDFKEFIKLLCDEFGCEVVPKKSVGNFYMPMPMRFLGLELP